MRRSRPLLALSALSALMCVGGCGHDQATQPADPAPAADNRYPVEVGPALTSAVTRHFSAPGSLEPFEIQVVSAQVAGVIRSIEVAEGDHVRVGQPIAHIADERYRLAVRSAEASLARCRAVRADADAAYARRTDLARTDPDQVNQEELAQYQAKAAQAAADLAQADSELERAHLDLSQTAIVAATDGVIQVRMAQTGSYAQPGTPLVSLVRRDPLRVRFTASSADAAQLTIGQRATFTLLDLRAERTARLTFVAAQADAASRLVTVMAEVDHDDPALVPGAFVEVATELGAPSPEVVIPETAVRPSERGLLVYILERDGARARARERLVAIDQRTSSGSISLRSGITPGEELVVRGADALHDGAEVRILARGATDRVGR